jgi:hypothetical protein
MSYFCCKKIQISTGKGHIHGYNVLYKKYEDKILLGYNYLDKWTVITISRSDKNGILSQKGDILYIVNNNISLLTTDFNRKFLYDLFFTVGKFVYGYKNFLTDYKQYNKLIKYGLAMLKKEEYLPNEILDIVLRKYVISMIND